MVLRVLWSHLVDVVVAQAEAQFSSWARRSATPSNWAVQGMVMAGLVEVEDGRVLKDVQEYQLVQPPHFDQRVSVHYYDLRPPNPISLPLLWLRQLLPRIDFSEVLRDLIDRYRLTWHCRELSSPVSRMVNDHWGCLLWLERHSVPVYC